MAWKSRRSIFSAKALREKAAGPNRRDEDFCWQPTHAITAAQSNSLQVIITVSVAR